PFERVSGEDTPTRLGVGNERNFQSPAPLEWFPVIGSNHELATTEIDSIHRRGRRCLTAESVSSGFAVALLTSSDWNQLGLSVGIAPGMWESDRVFPARSPRSGSAR